MVDELSGAPSSTRRVPAWSPRPGDLELLSQLADGRTVDTIARRMDVSERTIRRRLRAVADEIGVDSTIEAVVYAVRLKLI